MDAGALAIAVMSLVPGAPPSPLRPELLDDETYGETFTTIADLEDGTYVQIGLALSNLGPGDGNGYCYVLVVEPPGIGSKPWTAAAKFEREQWKFTDGPAATLEIGACHLRAEKGLEAAAELEGSSVRIALEASPARTEPPVHRIAIGSGFYESEILVPWSSAQVSLKMPGKADTRLITGHGYADHSRSTVLPTKLARMWIRFRDLAKEGSSLLLVRYPMSGDAHGYSWTEGQGSKPQEIQRVKSGRAKNGGEWKVLVETHNKAEWRITSKALLYRDAPTERHGMLGTLLGKIIGNPVTYTYRAMLEDASGKLHQSGILEVEVQE